MRKLTITSSSKHSAVAAAAVAALVLAGPASAKVRPGQVKRVPDRRAAIAGVDGVQPQAVDDGVTQPEPDTPLDKAKLERVAVSRITRTADGVRLDMGRYTGHIRVLAPDLVNVAVVEAGKPPPQSPGILEKRWPAVPITVRDAGPQYVIRTSSLTVEISKEPFGVRMRDRSGRIVSEDDLTYGSGYESGKPYVFKRTDPSENFYGFGEQTRRLNKRGDSIGLWNTDAYSYTKNTKYLYTAIPFFVGLKQGRAYGIMFDNTYRSYFEMASEDDRYFYFYANGGPLSYYFFNGPKIADVLARYTELTGRMKQPPQWSLGWHQSKWGYKPQSKIVEIARPAAGDRRRRGSLRPDRRPRDRRLRARRVRRRAHPRRARGACPAPPAPDRSHARLRGGQRAERVRAHLSAAGRLALPRRPPARGVLRRRRPRRGRSRRARAARACGRRRPARPQRGERGRRPGGDLARPGARVARGVRGRRHPRAADRREHRARGAQRGVRSAGRRAARADRAAARPGVVRARRRRDRRRRPVRSLRLHQPDPHRASRLPAGLVPIALGVWGLGMVAGSLAAGRLVDWRPLPGTFGIFVAMTAFFALFVVTSAYPVAAIATTFLLGTGLALPTALQVRLMDVSGEAQTLAAALNHSSFNAANAIGAWLGGSVLAAGLGLTAPIWVAVALTLAGMVLLAVSALVERRARAEVRSGYASAARI